MARGIERRKIFFDDKDRYEFERRSGDTLRQVDIECSMRQVSSDTVQRAKRLPHGDQHVRVSHTRPSTAALMQN